MCYNKYMNATKILKNIFKKNETVVVTRVPDKTITIDWAKRDMLRTNLNQDKQFGF
jgi:hypothetical protein